jgi:hypothetical protein
MKKTLIHDKITNIKVTWDGQAKFDVLLERYSDEWIVVDTVLSKPKNDKDVMKTANAIFYNVKETMYK